jgi:hypothetical protein
VDGKESVEVNCSLLKWNYLFKPSIITGEIVFDGVLYNSIYDLMPEFQYTDPNKTMIQLKIEGFHYDVFVIPQLLEGRQTELFVETIKIVSLDNNQITIEKMTPEYWQRFVISTS